MTARSYTLLNGLKKKLSITQYTNYQKMLNILLVQGTVPLCLYIIPLTLFPMIISKVLESKPDRQIIIMHYLQLWQIFYTSLIPIYQIWKFFFLSGKTSTQKPKLTTSVQRIALPTPKPSHRAIKKKLFNNIPTVNHSS
uniref:Uncharacterized protein n=1 Tax=Rhabditophanes sp. KR3021 TaxID=114890 RepID=A0AC35TPT0_9BILA